MNVEESKEMAARMLYFDILPENAISNIVRFLSTSPRAEKWANYINLADISGLYDVKGYLGTFLLTLCNALRLGDENVSSFLSLDDIEPAEAIGCEPEYILDSSLPERAAKSFRTLIVRHNGVSEDVRSHIDFISEKFPNIRKLLVGFVMTDRVWIKKFGPKLESLDCRILSSDIPKYCPHLRHLYLYSMRRYDSDMEFWEKSGEKLETLEVERPVNTIDVIGFVEKFCRKIKRLGLSGANESVQQAISKCVASYGNQLESVRLKFLTENELLRVKRACPKTRIELVTNTFLMAQTLKIVGSELEEVSVHSDDDDSQEMEDNSVDWSACTNIEKSRLHFRATVADIERFMKSPKYHLRLIEFSIYGELKKVKTAIFLLAKGTGGLEQLRFRCNGAAIGTFKELVDRNQSIRNVWISMYDSTRENEVATDIVKTFLISVYDVPYLR